MLALIAAVLVTQNPQPLVVKYRLIGKSIAIPVDSDQGPLVLALDSVYSKSQAQEKLSKKPLQITIDGKPLATVQMTKDNARVTDGSLGMDVLSKMSVGIDFMSQEVTIWPSGSVPEADAKAWVIDAQPWPGLGQSQPVEMPFTAGPFGAPIMDVKIDGRLQKTFLLMGFDATVINGRTEGLTDDPTTMHFVPKVQIGDETVPWLELCNAFQGRNPFLTDNADGLLSLENFWSRRVLIDFVSHKLYSEHLFDTGRLTLLLDRFSRLPLQVTMDGIVIGGPNMGTALHTNSLLGFPVQDLNGVPTNSIMRYLALPSKEGARSLAELVGLLSGPYVANVKMRDGGTTPLTAPGG